MSIEALPNELLVKIFSHLSWGDSWLAKKQRNQETGPTTYYRTRSADLLQNVSLVNRRWCQVIGPMTTLQLSKSIDRHPGVICIPLEVLYGSSREYSKFSCSLCSTDLQMTNGTFGAVLEYCHQRWNMNSLRIASCYDQFKLFLQHHKHLLNDVVRAKITVWGCTGCTDWYGIDDTHFVLPMEKLTTLNINYKAPSFCSLSLHAPKLEFLKVNRQSMLHLTFHNSTIVRSVLICGSDSRTIYSDPDPAELQSILPQAPNMTGLDATYCSIATTFSAMFGNLQTIKLTSVKITPTDDPLECLNLAELQLRDVELPKQLKLRVPQLRTLICDMDSLQSVHLQDAFKADLLAIDFAFQKGETNFVQFEDRLCLLIGNLTYRIIVTTPPVGLSSFRRLHLLLWGTQENDDTSMDWLWPYLSGITELRLQSNHWARYFHRLRNIWNNLPQLNSLRLLGMEVPNNLNFLPVNVQDVFIEDCLIEGGSIEFPPSVERVRIKKLWKQTKDDSSAGMILLPANRYAPLESELVRVFGIEINRMTTAYSTKDCPETDDTEKVFDLAQRSLKWKQMYGFYENV